MAKDRCHECGLEDQGLTTADCAKSYSGSLNVGGGIVDGYTIGYWRGRKHGLQIGFAAMVFQVALFWWYIGR